MDSEEDARRHIEETRRKYHDARHNCWCYLVRERSGAGNHGNDGNGGSASGDGRDTSANLSGAEIVRYADDGEPQGTAGQPMLNVFQRREVTDVCCVVTRYFGGVLLGAGGLTRAYSRAAKNALDAAGTAKMTLWSLWEVPCTWPLLERVKQELSGMGAVLEGAEYGEQAVLRAAFPDGTAERFRERLRELSAGQLAMRPLGEAMRPGEREA